MSHHLPAPHSASVVHVLPHAPVVVLQKGAGVPRRIARRSYICRSAAGQVARRGQARRAGIGHARPVVSIADDARIRGPVADGVRCGARARGDALLALARVRPRRRADRGATHDGAVARRAGAVTVLVAAVVVGVANARDARPRAIRRRARPPRHGVAVRDLRLADAGAREVCRTSCPHRTPRR